MGLQGVTAGYMRLQGLQGVTKGFKGFGYNGLQGVISGYKGLHGVTRGYWGLQWFIWG